MRVDEAEARHGGANTEGDGRNLSCAVTGAEADTVAAGRTKPEAAQRLLEAALERSNMLCAYERVVGNKGAPGVDGLTVPELKPWLVAHWPKVRQALLAGEYMPAAVRKVEIPKPQGGVRTLGIPTVVDRLVQQSLHQVMQPLFDPEFSASSYGFRPGRNAHQAVKAARSYVADGKRWVVDLDLEKFFDRVNHDVLMARVGHKVKDERVLKLIRRYLEAGLMEGGIASARTEGTPQGGPLSPLLSNILLDDLDRELEQQRQARGKSLRQVIERLNPVLRGWMAYFRLTEVKSVLEELDGWLRHKLRTLLWRQWKRAHTRARNLMKAGIDKVRAWKSATNGHGPWWNGNASHMNQAYPKLCFDRMGLVSLLDIQRRFQSVS
jgi:RNA-directed DNA polymerase